MTADIEVPVVGEWGGMMKIPVGFGYPSGALGVAFARKVGEGGVVCCRRGAQAVRRLVCVGSFRGPRG